MADNSSETSTPGNSPMRDAQSKVYHQASFELTQKGREVLMGTCDFVELNGIDLRLGGVHLLDGAAVWRWDHHHNQLPETG